MFTVPIYQILALYHDWFILYSYVNTQHRNPLLPVGSGTPCILIYGIQKGKVPHLKLNGKETRKILVYEVGWKLSHDVNDTQNFVSSDAIDKKSGKTKLLNVHLTAFTQ